MDTSLEKSLSSVLQVLHLVFPQCRVLLAVCMLSDISVKKYFQVCSIALSFGFGVKYNSEGSRNEDGTPVEKILILERVMACRDSHTSEQYNSNREALMELTEHPSL